MTEFAFPATLTRGGAVDVVTAFNFDADEPVYIADSHHPNWDAILDGLRQGNPNVWELFDTIKGVMAGFEQVTDRISWDGANVLWDGDPFRKPVADHLARCIEDGNVENYTAFAKFVEKLESNPTEHSREQAYDFLACHSFQITLDGDLVGYKGLYTTEEEGVYLSSASSQEKEKPSGFVNGVAVPPLQRIPQKVGDVVSMPRSEVAHDPTQACKRGLHVATHDYAAMFGNVVAEIHANPRDIVSVPTDGGGDKVRVNRYKVARLVTQRNADTPVLRDNSQTTTWTPDVSYRG